MKCSQVLPGTIVGFSGTEKSLGTRFQIHSVVWLINWLDQSLIARSSFQQIAFRESDFKGKWAIYWVIRISIQSMNRIPGDGIA